MTPMPFSYIHCLPTYALRSFTMEAEVFFAGWMVLKELDFSNPISKCDMAENSVAYAIYMVSNTSG